VICRNTVPNSSSDTAKTSKTNLLGFFCRPTKKKWEERLQKDGEKMDVLGVITMDSVPQNGISEKEEHVEEKRGQEENPLVLCCPILS
jgi:hypothetical protein